MTSQFCFCHAELGAALLVPAVRSASPSSRVLSSALNRIPSDVELRLVHDGGAKLGVLWRNSYSLLLAVAGGTVASTAYPHPDAAELQPSIARHPRSPGHGLASHAPGHLALAPKAPRAVGALHAFLTAMAPQDQWQSSHRPKLLLVRCPLTRIVLWVCPTAAAAPIFGVE